MSSPIPWNLHAAWRVLQQCDEPLAKELLSGVHGHSAMLCMRPLSRRGGSHLVREAGMDDRIPRNLAQVCGRKLPHLRRHTVLLHQWLLGQVDLRHADDLRGFPPTQLAWKHEQQSRTNGTRRADKDATSLLQAPSFFKQMHPVSGSGSPRGRCSEQATQLTMRGSSVESERDRPRAKKVGNGLRW